MKKKYQVKLVIPLLYEVEAEDQIEAYFIAKGLAFEELEEGLPETVTIEPVFATVLLAF
jgi:hypothetical protein